MAANIYASCDKAIQAMNRWNIESFGKLKMAKWDEVNIIRAVTSVYRQSARMARKKYRKVAYDSYLFAMYYMLEMERAKAVKMAEKAITDKWVDRILTETDFVTLYRFDTETERKAYRLAETLEATVDRDHEINKALRHWSQQLGQYAINFTDYALVQAYQDAGVKEVKWDTEHDEKVCNECYAYDGQKFKLDEIPVKPHWGCRCTILPVTD